MLRSATCGKCCATLWITYPSGGAPISTHCITATWMPSYAAREDFNANAMPAQLVRHADVVRTIPAFTEAFFGKAQVAGANLAGRLHPNQRAALDRRNAAGREGIVSSAIFASQARLLSHRGTRGVGQAINYLATDIMRVADGLIVENWKVEDHETLHQQLAVPT